LRRLPLPLLSALVLIAAAAGVAADRGRLLYSTTNDEPLHLAAAREVREGKGVVSNFEHPVLMKELAAAGLASAPPKLFVEETRAGRRLFPFVFAGLVLVTGLWGARRAGTWAGLAAAALVALDPTVRGHAPLVHNDVLLAFLIVLSGFLLDSVPRAGRGRFLLIVAAGAAYGLAIAAKYSALPFLLVFLVVAVVRLRPQAPPKAAKAAKRRGKPAAGPPRWTPALLQAAFLGATALATTFLVQEAALWGTPREELRAGIYRQFGGSQGIRGQEAALRWEERLPKGVAAYAAGLLFVRASSSTGVRFNYFLGKVSAHGSWLYFPIALLVKLTAAVVLGLLAAAALALLAQLRAPPLTRRRRLRAALSRACVPAALAAAYLFAAAASDMNIGVRHVLPVIPLGILAALALFRVLLRPRVLWTALLLCVVSGSAIEAGVRRGREIPFGNVLFGGPGPGLRRVLSDSNADWGEAQEKLFSRVSRGDLGRVGTVVLVLNDDQALALGMKPVEDAAALASFDTVVFSVHLLDVGRAIEKDQETYSKTRWLKGWLPPILRETERRAVAREPLGDEYVIYRLGPSA
jgi:hypothetical protein